MVRKKRSKKKTAKKSQSKTLLTINHWQTTNVARLVKQKKVKTTDLEVGDVIIDYKNDDVWQVAEVVKKGSAYDVRDARGNGAIAQASTEFIIMDRKCLVKGHDEPMFDED